MAAQGSTSLRGDPGFDVASLSGDAAVWFERVWGDVRSGGFDPIELAGSDCLYQYGRSLHTYVQAVLVVFRLTGDLALLDHVDVIAERMRAELRDGWRGTLDGSDGTRDGYLNWSYRYGDSAEMVGKDLDRSNEMKTHALIAMIAYALDVNRDLPSPGGRAYGEHADFWRDYLVNHFEAKWRERRGVSSGFPIMVRPHTHTYYSWMKWHHYMGLLTGDAGYRLEAERMAGVLSSEVREVSLSVGVAYVWPRSVLAEGGSQDYLHPTTYARYVFGDVVEMHLEGFDWWASEEVLGRFARTFTEFVMDRADPVGDGFASDIGGGESVAGLESDDSWSRMSADRFRVSSYALIGAWDRSEQLVEAVEDVYSAIGSRGGVWLSSGAFTDAWLASLADPFNSAGVDLRRR